MRISSNVVTPAHCLPPPPSRDTGEGWEPWAWADFLEQNPSLKGESKNPGCQKAKEKATELKIGALNRMSRKALYGARFDFSIANYLRHIMQNQTWEEDIVSVQVNGESGLFMT